MTVPWRILHVHHLSPYTFLPYNTHEGNYHQDTEKGMTGMKRTVHRHANASMSRYRRLHCAELYGDRSHVHRLSAIIYRVAESESPYDNTLDASSLHIGHLASCMPTKRDRMYPLVIDQPIHINSECTTELIRTNEGQLSFL